MENWADRLLDVALLALVCLMLPPLGRVIRGPGLAGRLLGVNLLGTQILAATALMAVDLDQPYLLDVALTLALLNFLGVALLSRMAGEGPKIGKGEK